MTMKDRIRTLKTRGITKCIESDYNLENHNNYETYIQTTCGRTRVPKENKRNPRSNLREIEESENKQTNKQTFRHY